MMKRRLSSWGAFILMIAVFLIAMVAFYASVNWTGGTATRRGAESVETAIKRAAVSAYALEGRYPATLDDISDSYGIVIDESRYRVTYEVFADNVMPRVSVKIRGNSN